MEEHLTGDDHLRGKSDKMKIIRKRVSDLRGFYTHLVIYICVIAFLAFVDFMEPGSWWVYWPALAWGIAVIIHWYSLMLGPAWEEKKIKELLEQEKNDKF